jgi:TfoX/Sxy family transcriptional regulator of competence genes
MAFDEKAGERLRRAVGEARGLSESRMFGGLTLLINGNMCCGIAGDELVIRVDRDRSETLSQKKHARPCDITGRPMRGLVTVSPEGFGSAATLRRWVSEAVDHASSLPPKVPKKSKKKTAKKK